MGRKGLRKGIEKERNGGGCMSVGDGVCAGAEWSTHKPEKRNEERRLT